MSRGQFWHAIGALIGIATLAACSNAGTVAIAGKGMNAESRWINHLTNTSTAAMLSPGIHADRGKSWIDSEKKKKAKGTLWISDYGTDDVYIYALPSLSLAGKLTGFNGPQGMCTDKEGNVFVTNEFAENVIEYSPAGKQIGSLSQPYTLPDGCSVSKSGDLAVSSLVNFYSPGSISVYKKPYESGSGKVLRNPAQYVYYFVAYDPSGNLYTDGRPEGGEFMLSVCPAGETLCKTVSISGATIYFPGLVQWDDRESANRHGTDLYVGDQACDDGNTTCIYAMSISGSTATVTNKITLENYEGGSVCDLIDGVLNARYTQIGGGDWEKNCGYASTTADTWAAPAGSKPTAYNAGSGLNYPIGAAYTK